MKCVNVLTYHGICQPHYWFVVSSVIIVVSISHGRAYDYRDLARPSKVRGSPQRLKILRCLEIHDACIT